MPSSAEMAVESVSAASRRAANFSIICERRFIWTLPFDSTYDAEQDAQLGGVGQGAFERRPDIQRVRFRVRHGLR